MVKEPLLHFVETKVFRRKLDKLIDLTTLFAIQSDLIENPKKGKVMQDCGGARKARVADKMRKTGKSGSFLYIYLYLENVKTIYLFMFYGKNEEDTLNDEEKKEVAWLVKQYKDLYGEK